MSVQFPPITEVADLLGIDYKQEGGSLKAVCPFCGNTEGARRKARKMIITPSGDVYHCFKCGEKGKTLSLYSKVKFGKEYEKGDFKQVYQSLMNDMHLVDPTFGTSSYRAKPVKRIKEIPPTTNERLNEVYQTLLNFPSFALSQKHRQKLLDRGLPAIAIERNGYRTVPSSFSWVWGYFPSKEVISKITELAKGYDVISKATPEKLTAMYIVAQYVVTHAGEPYGVSGFFKLGEWWLVRLDSGILIPTRNSVRQITALQTRTDYGNIRYLTLSSRGLPEGVNVSISRSHFPLANAPIDSTTKVLVTEGPLKADITAELLEKQGRKCAVVAFHGVSVKAVIRPALKWLHDKCGVTVVYNAFDMDRLLNVNVIKATDELVALANEVGIKVVGLYWDEEEGCERASKLLALCNENHIECSLEGKWYKDLPRMALNLSRGKVPFFINADGEKELWSNASKGIDDYLNSLQN